MALPSVQRMSSDSAYVPVMAGLVPAIHVFDC
jgi:hypothetical protein